MKQLIVRRKGRVWTIRFMARDFDEFCSLEEAVSKALEWAAKARLQGHSVRVLTGSSVATPEICCIQPRVTAVDLLSTCLSYSG